MPGARSNCPSHGPNALGCSRPQTQATKPNHPSATKTLPLLWADVSHPVAYRSVIIPRSEVVAECPSDHHGK